MTIGGPLSLDVTRKRFPGEQPWRRKRLSVTTEIEGNESAEVVEEIEKDWCTLKYAIGSKDKIKVFKLALFMKVLERISSWYKWFDSQVGNNELTVKFEQKSSIEGESSEEEVREVWTEGSSSKRWKGSWIWKEGVVEGQLKEWLSREVEGEWWIKVGGGDGEWKSPKNR